MSMCGRQYLWLSLLVLVKFTVANQFSDLYRGSICWPKIKKDRDCYGSYRNLPILNGVYCSNDGTGNCKAFAGRFEFEFNTFTDTIKGPVAKSKFVDEYGYHERVPVAYNIKGEIIYADRSINWARKFKKLVEKSPKSLLSAIDINWCQYTIKDWWPYKSAILDPTKRYQIYFFNRQSCIYDTQAQDKSQAFQHFNTRFMHNSSLRIDLDMNPLIFVMEDKSVAKGTDRLRLVKNKRQHWYEVKFKVTQPGGGIRYFVDMDDQETLPCKINPRNPVLIPATSYNSQYCIEENARAPGAKNNLLFTPDCGIDQEEIVDVPKPLYKKMANDTSIWIQVNLHNIPRYPFKTSEYFYGLDIEDSEHWQVWAKDGYVFTATTTIPTEEPQTVEVISFYAKFEIGGAPKTDENYPTPYLARYRSTLIPRSDLWNARWEFDKSRPTKKRLPNLNYVDDIAYLAKCKTILAIYGPLYSEYPADKFDSDAKAPIDSIYQLNIWEMVNAFFAMPDETDPTLWVYHRSNHVTGIRYECGKGGKLVTGQKHAGGRYYYTENSLNSPPFMYAVKHEDQQDYSEETFFKDHGVFKGNANDPACRAPDPQKYPIPDDDIEKPLGEKENTWLWWVIGAALLLIVLMCLICMLAIRRRRRRAQLEGMTKRSSSLPRSASSNVPSVRSRLHHGRSSALGRPTARSSLRTSRPSSRHSAATVRSQLPSRSAVISSPSSASKYSTRRSSISKPSRSARSSRSSSRRTPSTKVSKI